MVDVDNTEKHYKSITEYWRPLTVVKWRRTFRAKFRTKYLNRLVKLPTIASVLEDRQAKMAKGNETMKALVYAHLRQCMFDVNPYMLGCIHEHKITVHRRHWRSIPTVFN